MSDIFRIDSGDDIKLTGGARSDGLCTHTDTRDVRTKTELESGAQNAGGNDSSPQTGISAVFVEGCLTGSGTEALPISVVLNPTGGIACGDDGLFITNVVVVTGVTATSITTSGCLTGSGTPASPARVLLNPTGGIQCTVAGLALQQTYLTQVITSGCVGGIGTAGSPVVLNINPTGGIHCTPGGLAVQFPAPTGLNNVSVASPCISGNGTAASPLSILFNPTGGIQCTAGGIALQDVYLTQVVTSGCVGGIGTAGSPLVLSVNPTGGLHCTPGGLAMQSLFSAVIPTGCLTGSGTLASPLAILFDPTGKIHCTPAGLALQETYLTQVITSGCLGGIGTAGSPIILTINPTGGLHCTPGGLAVNLAAVAATGTLCHAYSYETGSAPVSPSAPTTPMINPASGNVQVEVYDSVIRFWMFNGTGYVLDKEFSGGGGGGTPSSPLNSVQFNNAGSFGGSSGLLFNGTNLTVTGVITAKNFATVTYAISDGTGVIINPSNGGIQTWTLGASRTPSGIFHEGEAVTLMIDDGSSNTIDWGTLNPTWLDGAAPTLPTSGYGIVELWKVGGVLYGASLASGVTSGTTSPASPANSIQFNNGGSFGGSSRLTWDGTVVGISGSINVSGTTLQSDSSHILAQRNGANSQGLRIYNTYTNGSIYERGVFDWIGSPGVLQIGTQHAGATARGLQLITSGTPRIDIQAGGAIQFYGAYTFPSTNGASGQVLTTNGAGTLTWGNVSGAASSADYFIDEIDEGNSGTSFTVNFGTKANHKLTLTGHCTLSFTAPASARETKIRFVQGGTGGYSITLPSGTLGTTPVLPTGVGSQSVVTLFYDRDGNWHV